jgi:hypothetical protein
MGDVGEGVGEDPNYSTVRRPGVINSRLVSKPIFINLFLD